MSTLYKERWDLTFPKRMWLELGREPRAADAVKIELRRASELRRGDSGESWSRQESFSFSVLTSGTRTFSAVNKWGRIPRRRHVFIALISRRYSRPATTTTRGTRQKDSKKTERQKKDRRKTMADALSQLPPKYDDLPDKKRYWPAPAGSREEGLGMLRLLTPKVVADAARTEIRTGDRVCLNWDMKKLDPPGMSMKIKKKKKKKKSSSSSSSNC